MVSFHNGGSIITLKKYDTKDLKLGGNLKPVENLRRGVNLKPLSTEQGNFGKVCCTSTRSASSVGWPVDRPKV